MAGYAVTTEGRVFSGIRTPKPRLVNGYHLVTLCRPGKKWQVSVHRLMASTFIRPFQPGEVTNHLNGVRTDNRLTNIEITTQSRNVKHAYEHGLRVIDDAHKARAAALGRARRKAA